MLDEPALAGVADAGARAVVLDASTVDGDAGTAGAVPVAVGSSSLLAVLTDPLLARAADAPEASAPAIPGTATTVSATTVSATTSPPLATQDAAAALVFRAQAAKQPAGGAPIVLAPPHVWRTDKTGAGALLAAVNLLLDTGRVRARRLGDVVAAGPTTPGAARRPADPLQAGSRDIPPTVLESVREMRADVLDLRSAAVPETGVGATVDATFEPLLQAVLRPASATWHGRPDLAASAATAAGTRIGELRDSVRVLTPPSPYSLGTSDAPLLLTIANGLPVTMEVRLSISSTTGLRVAPIPPQRIPPLGRRQVQVSAEVVRSGQFSVEATVHSPAGRALGPPSRLQVRSTAYGTITRVVDGIRGRAARRAGGAPGGAPGAGRAEPARPDRALGRPPDTRGPPDADRDADTRDAAPGTGGGGTGAPDGPADGTGPRVGPGTPHDAGAHAARPGAPDPSGTGPPPVTHADRPRRRGPSLGRASSLMAVASLVSRVTGFLRQLALVSVLGLGVVNDSYTVANTLPNIVYELLLGGVLTSVMVPLLVRAQTEDADGGRGLHPAPAHRGGRGARPRDPRGDGDRAAAHPPLPRRRRRTGEPAARDGLRLAAAAADLLLRRRRAARGDAQHPWRVRAVRLGAGAQQRRRPRRARGLRRRTRPDQPGPRAAERPQAAGARHRHDARHRRAGAGDDPGGAPDRLPLPADVGLGPAARRDRWAGRVGRRDTS